MLPFACVFVVAVVYLATLWYATSLPAWLVWTTFGVCSILWMYSVHRMSVSTSSTPLVTQNRLTFVLGCRIDRTYTPIFRPFRGTQITTRYSHLSTHSVDRPLRRSAMVDLWCPSCRESARVFVRSIRWARVIVYANALGLVAVAAGVLFVAENHVFVLKAISKSQFTMIGALAVGAISLISVPTLFDRCVMDEFDEQIQSRSHNHDVMEEEYAKSYIHRAT
jgi:hypothetical protein